MLAFLVVGAFVIFVFFGKEGLTTNEPITITTMEDSQVVTIVAVDGEGKPFQRQDTSLYVAVLTSFGTLTGAVTAFYFANRAVNPR